MADRIWSISNLMSVSRVLLLVPLGYCLFTEFEGNRYWAGAIIGVAAVTDFLDGLIARRLHQVSEIGKVVDPLADKIGVAVLAVFLVILGNIPVWFLIVTVLRDVLIVAGGMYIRNKKKIITQSNWPGKIAVGMIALYLLLSTLLVAELEWLRLTGLWGSMFFMVLSLILYARRLLIGRHVELQGE